jgi:hypothetical protein
MVFSKEELLRYTAKQLKEMLIRGEKLHQQLEASQP